MWIIMDILELYVTINYGMMSLCAMYVVALLLKYWSEVQWGLQALYTQPNLGDFIYRAIAAGSNARGP